MTLNTYTDGLYYHGHNPCCVIEDFMIHCSFGSRKNA